MPGKSLPVLSASDVAQHNSSKSCYVTVGRKVYDVTSFLGDHPGGDDLILDWAGKDVSAILKDELSHTHSEAAYEILDDYLVGIIRPETNGATTNGVTTNGTCKSAVNGDTNVATNGVTNGVPAKRPAFESTGLSCAEELSIDTDLNADFKTHHFLDLNRPLLPQLWTSGFSKRFYLEQVHRPRHYKGGASAPLFGNFLEPLSKTAWWVVPTVWLPAVAYGTYIGMQGFKHNILAGAAYWSFGVFCWTLVEYFLHRFLFHIDKFLPDNRVGITAHFLLHGIHHYLPMDKYRLVMPPALFLILASPWYRVAHMILFYNWYAAVLGYTGAVFGYICYDMTHYFLHHRNLPLYYRHIKKLHLEHHFADYDNGFGVTSPFWDHVFGTTLRTSAPSKRNQKQK